MAAGRTVNSKSVSWGTPKKYVDSVVEVLGEIHLDPCSNEYSIVPAYTKICLPEDGLKADWTEHETIYVNPPYGRDSERGTSIKDWIKKAYDVYCEDLGHEIMMLIPVATNTKHWKEYVLGKATICFLDDTRLKFLEDGVPSEKGAPMACAMIYYGDDDSMFKAIFRHHGHVTK